MAYVALTTAQTDADSPLNETLFTQIKDNFDALDGADVTNGDAHDHVGGDGAQIGIGGVASSVIGQGELKWGTGSFTTGVSSASFVVVRYSHTVSIRAYSYSGAYPNYATLTRQSSTASGSDTGREERYILTNSDTTATNESTAEWDYHIA